MLVLKITTHDGKKFYTDTKNFTLQDLQEIVDRTHNVYQVDELEMTEEEYHQVPFTSEAVEFFGKHSGEAPEKEEEDG